MQDNGKQQYNRLMKKVGNIKGQTSIKLMNLQSKDSSPPWCLQRAWEVLGMCSWSWDFFKKSTWLRHLNAISWHSFFYSAFLSIPSPRAGWCYKSSFEIWLRDRRVGIIAALRWVLSLCTVKLETEKAPTNTPTTYIPIHWWNKDAGSEVTSHLAPEVCRLWERKKTLKYMDQKTSLKNSSKHQIGSGGFDFVND